MLTGEIPVSAIRDRLNDRRATDGILPLTPLTLLVLAKLHRTLWRPERDEVQYRTAERSEAS